MKILSLSLAGCGAALILCLAPVGGAALAQPMPADPAVTGHGDWTLHDREDWVSHQLETAKNDGSLDDASFNQARLEMDDLRKEESRMRHDGHGELTGNQTADLETRLDTMVAKVHWANESEHNHPW